MLLNQSLNLTPSGIYEQTCLREIKALSSLQLRSKLTRLVRHHDGGVTE